MLLSLFLLLYYRICYLGITSSPVVICQERPDDLEVVLGLFDEGHVAGVLEDLPAHVGNAVEERLQRRGRRLVESARREQRRRRDLVHLVDDRPVAQLP